MSKKQTKTVLLAGIFLLLGMNFCWSQIVGSAEDGIFWKEDFDPLKLDATAVSGWQTQIVNGVSAFSRHGKTARLRGGSALIYLPYDFSTAVRSVEYPYLQIKVAGASTGWSIRDANGIWSTGQIKQAGLFTFDFKTFMTLGTIPGHWTAGEKAAGILSAGTLTLVLQAGTEGFVDFNWIQMISRPLDGVILKVKKKAANPDVIRVGDTIQIQVMLSAPAQRGVVRFENLEGNKPVSFDGEKAKKLFDDGTHGDIIPGDNVWTAEYSVTAGAGPLTIGKGGILVTALITGGKIEKTFAVIPFAVDTAKK